MELGNLVRGVTKHWWIPLLTGLLGIGIGVWCLLSPMTSLPILAYAFCIILMVTGLFNLFFALANSRVHSGWGWYLAYGIIEILCGAWLVSLPLEAMTVAFVYAIGIYLIFVAVNAICESCMFSGLGAGWFGWFIALLLATLFFAIIFLAGPIAGGIAVWLCIGISFICYGLFRVMISIRMKKLNDQIR